ncbi:hypothetical protein EXIGLDRAFT_750750 [Exidia glandulosa HHB12029]|uniref:Protein transport protein sec16 n=1 Tax=Exidia glandulosa HHB12029 TaxID=1314781 RepID=A0A165GBE0_EXIGL|nr:hypothetical protein EXIGLDRAFT_750750 [Exidia glandulosa HHB12029]
MADNAHNQSIEAADLLFASSDSSAADFFGSVITDEPAAHPAPAASQPAPADQHTAPDASHDVDALFGSGGASDSLFDVAPVEEFAVHDAQSTDALQHQDAAADYAQSTDYSQQGWYDDDGQWHYYETQDTNGSAYYEADPYTAQSAAHSDAQASQVSASYDPYAPAHDAAQAQASAAGSQYYGYEASSYNPSGDTTANRHYAQSAYAPAQTTSSTYAPAATPHVASDSYVSAANTYQPQSTYDPYAPTTTTTHSAYNYNAQAVPSPYAPPVSTYAPPAPSYAPLAALPTAQATLSRDDTIKPRKPAVSEYRSSSYNAYDPPIPAAKPRSRHANASSHAAPSLYDTYNRASSPAQQPAPPPPRAAAVPPPPRTNSAMSARASASYVPPPSHAGASSVGTNGTAFFDSLAPPQQSYSLNSPNYSVQQLEPEVAQYDPYTDSASAAPAAAAYGPPAVNGYGTANHASAPHSVQQSDTYDPEGGSGSYDPEGGEPDPEFQAFGNASQRAASAYGAYGSHAPPPPRVASRAASVASPPLRPSSVASPPPRIGSAVSYAPKAPSTTMSPPPRAPSVASPPPRVAAVASPPPRASSVASVSSATSQSANGHSRYASSIPGTVSPPHSVAGSVAGSPYDPYAPKTAMRRETSDYASSTTSATSQPDPYRPRTASIASVASSAMSPPPPPPAAWGSPPAITSAYAPTNGTASYAPVSEAYAPPTASPYGPPPVRTRGASEASDYSNYGASRYGYAGQSGDDARSVTSEAASITAPTYTAYAPSPSLSGVNDPLGRASARVPVFSFGFGGKVVSCFHTPAGLTDGFDVSFSGRPSTTVGIKRLHEIIPSSAWETSSATFPGPLLSDPGTPTTSLVPPVRSSNTSKTKKAAVIKYLDDRAEEIEKGLGYLSDNTMERNRAEAKLVLVRLLRVVVDNDGQFSGNEKVEAAVRSALLGPRAETTTSSANDALRPADTFAAAYGVSSTSEAPIAVYELRPSALDKLQEFLLRGERRKAYHFALDEKMWTHALLLAKDLDKDSWKEAVQEFIRAELMTPTEGAESNGRESLRIMYSLISGSGASSVHELVPPKALGQPRVPEPAAALAVTPMHITPMTANFTQPTIPTNVPNDILGRWQDIAATVVSNHVLGDSSGLTALGDTLLSHKWVEAAHACYLLSRSTSSISGCSNTASARIVLLGSPNPASSHSFSKDQDPFIFTEILEFALSLAPASNGQDVFVGFPHLQAYRLLRAWHMVEMGHERLAQRYCDAVAATVRTINRGSPFFTLTFLEQLKELSDRLTAAPQLDKGGSWLTKKMAKPSLDSLGTWLGGRLTDFIAGEAEPAEPSTEVTAEQPPKPSTDPFSHYSTISSASTSANPSPPPQANNLLRTGSAMSFRTSTAPSIQIDRASSAIDYLRPAANRTSPVPRIASANAATTSFSQAAANGRYGNPPYNSFMPSPTKQASTDEGESQGQDASMPWWGNSYGEDSGATPTAASFVRADEPPADNTSGFISLMDTPSPAISAAPSKTPSRSGTSFDEDDDELGFGNKSTKKSKSEHEEGKQPASKPAEKAPAAAAVALPSDAAKAGGGWFSRIWGSKAETPGPVKANLGEETSFYYDKELKRWVNKKAGASAGPATPPPPPPRAQTASPSMARPAVTSTPPPPPGPAGGPPRIARPASVAELALSKPPRIRSNLVPDDEPAGTLSVPGTPPPPSGASTPPMRPKSQASAKRSVRSRYVDVFAQQEGGA